MVKPFKDWTKFEKTFLILGTLAPIVSTIIFKSPIIDLINTLLFFWAAILLVKGKYASYIIGIASSFFYAYVSYKNQYWLHEGLTGYSYGDDVTIFVANL